jgi:hypothetical protein
MVNVSDRFNRGLNNSGYDTDCAKRVVENKPEEDRLTAGPPLIHGLQCKE